MSDETFSCDDSLLDEQPQIERHSRASRTSFFDFLIVLILLFINIAIAHSVKMPIAVDII